MCWSRPGSVRSSVTAGHVNYCYSRSDLFKIRRATDYNSKLTEVQLNSLSVNGLLHYRGSRGRGRRLRRGQARITIISGHRPRKPVPTWGPACYSSLRPIQLVSYNVTKVDPIALNSRHDPPALCAPSMQPLCRNRTRLNS